MFGFFCDQMLLKQKHNFIFCDFFFLFNRNSTESIFHLLVTFFLLALVHLKLLFFLLICTEWYLVTSGKQRDFNFISIRVEDLGQMDLYLFVTGLKNINRFFEQNTF